MNKDGKIILSAIVAIGAISTLFAVVPINGTFITSYIFAVIAICLIAGTTCIYGKRKSNAVAGLSYVYTSVVYAVVSVVFSVVVCLFALLWTWTLVLHVIILAIFAIRIISSNIGSDYINEIDKKSEEKHNDFLNKKKNYWK